MGNSTLATLGIAINAQQGIRTLDTLNSKLGGLTSAANIAQMATAAVFSGGAIFAAKEMVKYASDVQETTSKFNVVFKNVSDAADAAFSNLSNNYNMSGQAARTMLSDTGDLLSGFGMAANVALDLSNRVNILATDLSSFTNYAGGASGASDALTKALLGEREQAKMLGLAIKETDVQAQMALDAKNGEIYASESAAKAYATYKIMLSQSKNAIGDTARSVDNYQYKLNTLTKVVGEAKEAIGGALIAPATKIIESINRVVGAFNRLPDTIKNTVAIGGTLLATLGGLAIGFAPVISAIANMAMARRMERAEAERGTASNTANAASFNESTTTTYANTVATNANTQAKESNAAVGGTAAVDANTYSVLSNTDAANVNTYSTGANTNATKLNTDTTNANTGSLILNTSAEAENAAAVTTSNFTDAAKTGSLSLRTAALEVNSEATNVNTISTNADANASSSFIVCKGAETAAIIANTEARVANAAAGAGMAFGAAGRAATSGGTSKAGSTLFAIPGLNIVIGLLGKMGAAVLRFVPPLKWCINAFRVAGSGIGSIGSILIKAASCVAVFSASFIGTMKAIQAAPVLLENFKRYFSEAFTWENVKSATKHAADAIGGMFLWVGEQINKTADSLGEFIKGLVGINTMTSQRVAAEYYQKTIDDYAEFRQSQIDADNAALDERKRIAESINIATNEHHKNTNRLFLTSEQKKAAERQDEIDVSGKKYNSLLAPALTRAKNNDDMERLEADRKKYVQQGNDAKAQMALDNEVLKSVGLSKAERALLEKRIKANEKIIKDSKENEEKILKAKQLLEQNADPAAYAKAVSEIFLLLGKQVKLGEEAQAKWPELATQLEEASKTGDSDKVAGVANALFTAIAEDAGVGSEISEAWHKAKENFTEEARAADATAPMKGINNMLTLLSQNPEFKKFAPLFEKFKDEVIKTAGVAPDYLALANAALEDSSLRLVDAVEKAKQNAERDDELFDLGLKQEELTAYTPREHNEVVEKRLLNTRGRITQSQQANIDAPRIKKEIDDIESHIAQEIAKGENIDGKKIAELQEQLESKRNAYAQAQVLVKTPKELLELANEETELQNKLRSGSTEIFRRDLEDIQSLMEDSFFEVNQALEAANTAFDKATKGSDNITPQNYKTAVDQYREQINTRAYEEKKLHQLELEKLQQRHKEIKDEDGYQEERRQIERDIAKKNQLLGYTNADGNKVEGTIETERISQVNALDEKQSEHSKNWNEKQNKLREESIAMLDQLNLKEAKTSEERMAIYRRQWLDLEQAYASAPTDEERLSYVSKLTALSDTIKNEYAKRFDDNWKTAAPQKAIKAGTSDASAIQNRLFNNYQKIMAKNSDVSVTLNRAISTSLEKILENSSRDTVLSFAGGNS